MPRADGYPHRHRHRHCHRQPSPTLPSSESPPPAITVFCAARGRAKSGERVHRLRRRQVTPEMLPGASANATPVWKRVTAVDAAPPFPGRPSFL